jgi:hypothetical protein
MHRSSFVTRLALTLLAAVCALTSSVSTVGAAPARPAGCTFESGFASFRQALGEEIVGECRSAPRLDSDGILRQQTTEGTLRWSASANLVSFHDGFSTWVDGPGGIGSDVTIGGLSDQTAAREPVVTQAVVALGMASLGPEDLGDNWEYVPTKERIQEPVLERRPLSVREETAQRETTRCTASQMVPLRLGTLHTWLGDRQTRKVIHQTLMAFPGDGAERMRERAEQYVAACAERTIEGNGEPYTARMRLDPFVELGDDSYQIVFDYEGQQSGTRRTARVGVVRYGGLLSWVQYVRDRASPEEGDAQLRWLAERAHERMQHAAWHLWGLTR